MLVLASETPTAAIPPCLYAPFLQFQSCPGPRTDNVLSLLMAQFSLAIPVFCFFQEECRAVSAGSGRFHILALVPV